MEESAQKMIIRKLELEDAERFKTLRIKASGESPTSFYPSPKELIDTPAQEFLAQVTPAHGTRYLARLTTMN